MYAAMLALHRWPYIDRRKSILKIIILSVCIFSFSASDCMVAFYLSIGLIHRVGVQKTMLILVQWRLCWKPESNSESCVSEQEWWWPHPLTLASSGDLFSLVSSQTLLSMWGMAATKQYKTLYFFSLVILSFLSSTVWVQNNVQEFMVVKTTRQREKKFPCYYCMLFIGIGNKSVKI